MNQKPDNLHIFQMVYRLLFAVVVFSFIYLTLNNYRETHPRQNYSGKTNPLDSFTSIKDVAEPDQPGIYIWTKRKVFRPNATHWDHSCVLYRGSNNIQSHDQAIGKIKNTFTVLENNGKPIDEIRIIYCGGANINYNNTYKIECGKFQGEPQIQYVESSMEPYWHIISEYDSIGFRTEQRAFDKYVFKLTFVQPGYYFFGAYQRMSDSDSKVIFFKI